ncbi:MAG: M20/M25/M40 family metallo-hydrolase [Flavobacteriaceae bacterium]|nr:M20/M25/M40 family metallo-hydrolase [Flavobacteriaceae bacterium]
MKKFLVLLLSLCSTLVFSQIKEDVIQAKAVKTLYDLKDFIALPNDAAKPDDIGINLRWLTKRFSELGFNTILLESETVPSFFATLPMKPELPTVLFYMHFDGQAVDKSKWDQKNPYEMVLKSNTNGRWNTLAFDTLKTQFDEKWRVFGRSVSDDKGPIVMFLNAFEWIKKENIPLAFNIKVILDGEEEQSSPSLAKLVKTYKELLEADLLIINDGPVHDSHQPTLVFGARGITEVKLTAYGPNKPLHSGHYGNYIPNPNFIMARTLTSLKDKNGKVLIPGFYDGITLDDETKSLLKEFPVNQAKMLADLGVAKPETMGDTYQESLQFPSLNVRGMQSAWVGDDARTVIPDKTITEIDIRLVPESDGKRLLELFKKHLQNQGFYITENEPTVEERQKYSDILRFETGSIMPAFRTPIDNPYTTWLTQVLNQHSDEKVIKVRISGGTVPIAPFVNELKIPAITVPMVNPDNNQHSPNENLELKQVLYGLKTFYGLFTTPIQN